MLQQLTLQYEPEDDKLTMMTCCVEWPKFLKPNMTLSFKEDDRIWTILESFVLPVRTVEHTWKVGGI